MLLYFDIIKLLLALGNTCCRLAALRVCSYGSSNLAAVTATGVEGVILPYYCKRIRRFLLLRNKPNTLAGGEQVDTSAQLHGAARLVP